MTPTLTQPLIDAVTNNRPHIQESYGELSSFLIMTMEFLNQSEECFRELQDLRLKYLNAEQKLEQIEASLELETAANTQLSNEQQRRAHLKKLKHADAEWIKLTRETLPRTRAHIDDLEFKLKTLGKLQSLSNSIAHARF